MTSHFEYRMEDGGNKDAIDTIHLFPPCAPVLTLGAGTPMKDRTRHTQAPTHSQFGYVMRMSEYQLTHTPNHSSECGYVVGWLIC